MFEKTLLNFSPDPLLDRREALPLRDLDLLPRELRLPERERPVEKKFIETFLCFV